MEVFEQIKHYVFHYYGIDWVVTLTVFAGIFLLSDKKKLGFVVGMISATVGFIFSFQIGSIANGVTSIVLFFLYLRSYIKWTKPSKESA